MQIRHISDCWDWGYIKKIIIKKKRKKKGNTTVYARLLGLEIKKKRKKSNKQSACASRESNPGQYRGRVL